MGRRFRALKVLSAALAMLAMSAPMAAAADTTVRASVSSGGVQGNLASTATYVTPNGRHVVFISGSNNLVASDTNNATDVFVRDLVTGTTSRVSIPDPGTGNTQANAACVLGRSGVRYCSDDARYVVFMSTANNLVNNDTNGDPPFHIDGKDIFVRDRDLDNDGIYDEAGVGNTKTVRVSVTTNESQYIEFTIGLDTYGGGVSNPSISANGRYVAFECEADNLGSENGTIGSNVYWRDRDNDGNGIFDESGSTGGGVDRAITRLVSKVSGAGGSDGFSEDPAISGDGLHVAFVTASQILDYDTVFDLDTNGDADVYSRKMSDLNTNKSQRISLRSDEAQTNGAGHSFPSISFDGRYVAFTTSNSQLLPVGQDTNNTTDVYVRDRGNASGGNYILSFGSTYRVSLGVSFLIGGSNLFRELSTPSTEPFISSSGRYVLFKNNASDVICSLFGCFNTGGFDHVFLRDTLAGSEGTEVVSLTSGGSAANGSCSFAATSDDTSVVSFQSVGTNLVLPDNNAALSDVYALKSELTAFSWRSVRTHNGPAPLAISLNAAASGNGSSGPGTESRQGGIQRIEVDFSTDATLINPSAVSVIGRTTVGGVMGAPVNYSGLATVSMVDSDTLALTFAPGALPDETCYAIDLTGVVANGVGLLAGDPNVNVRSLYADTTSNGTVNLTDVIRVKLVNGQPAGSYPQTDVNLSGGNITNADMLATKARVTSPAHQVICP